MEQLIQEALKTPEKLSEILADKTAEEKEEFMKSLLKEVDSKLESEHLSKFITDTLEAIDTDIKAQDADAFREFQDKVVNFFGELNEDGLKIAVCSYLENEGQFDGVQIPDTPVLFSELYDIDEDELKVEAKLSTKSRDSLPDSSFCGPNRSFPVHDKAHAVAALRLIGRYKGGDKDKILACIHRKAKKFGVGGESENITLYPILVEMEDEDFTPIAIKSVEDLEKLQSEINSVKETYNLSDDDLAQLETFLTESKTILENTDPLLLNEDCKTDPIALSSSFFKEYFVRRESSDIRKYLVPLVGIIRSNKITKDVFEKLAKTYDVFGTLTLEKWLANVPEKIGNETVKDETLTQLQQPPAVIQNESKEVKPEKNNNLITLMGKKRSTRG